MNFIKKQSDGGNCWLIRDASYQDGIAKGNLVLFKSIGDFAFGEKKPLKSIPFMVACDRSDLTEEKIYRALIDHKVTSEVEDALVKRGLVRDFFADGKISSLEEEKEEMMVPVAEAPKQEMTVPLPKKSNRKLIRIATSVGFGLVGAGIFEILQRIF